jgi:hypothetical protein
LRERGKSKQAQEGAGWEPQEDRERSLDIGEWRKEYRERMVDKGAQRKEYEAEGDIVLLYTYIHTYIHTHICIYTILYIRLREKDEAEGGQRTRAGRERSIEKEA